LRLVKITELRETMALKAIDGAPNERRKGKVIPPRGLKYLSSTVEVHGRGKGEGLM